MKKGEKKKQRREERRRLLLARRKKKAKTMMIVSVMLIAMICVVVYVGVSMSGNENIQNNEPTQPPPPETETGIRIPISDIGNNPPNFYEYDVDGIMVKYFAIKGSDGQVHVAFNACDLCYDKKKGYTQDGNDMRCINCGLTYAINSIGTENIEGGCWPSYLPMKIDGDNIILEISDLEAKSWMF